MPPSGLPVSFQPPTRHASRGEWRTGPNFCPGEVTFTAIQPGDARFEPAAPVSHSFTIGFGNLFFDSAPGLRLWLDANDVNGDNVRDDQYDFIFGNKVSMWADKSGNTNNPIQAVDANMTRWLPNSLNEKPVVSFDSGQEFRYSKFGAKPSIRVHRTQAKLNGGLLCSRWRSCHDGTGWIF